MISPMNPKEQNNNQLLAKKVLNDQIIGYWRIISDIVHPNLKISIKTDYLI